MGVVAPGEEEEVWIDLRRSNFLFNWPLLLLAVSFIGSGTRTIYLTLDVLELNNTAHFILSHWKHVGCLKVI